jgi:predicted nucleotidyltransferase
MKIKNLHQEFMQVVNSLIKKKIRTEPIQAVTLWGSVARGDETKHSDIDIIFYVKKKDMPKDTRRFYKFDGKYIEEHYFRIEKLKSENILPEVKILYNKTGKIIKPEFNERKERQAFVKKLMEAENYLKLAKNCFQNKAYEKSFNYLYGIGAPASIIMHALPPRYNLPFPTLRLLNSVKIIDKKNKTQVYPKIKQIYNFNNIDVKEILLNFEKAYKLMNKIKRRENPGAKNLGFFDKIKIKYAIESLKENFKDYPLVYAYRFIVECLTGWAFDKKIKLNERKKLRKYLLRSLGIANIDKDLIKQKLRLFEELIEEVKK